MAPASPHGSFGIGSRCLSGYCVIILLGLFTLAIARPDDGSSTGSYTFTNPDGSITGSYTFTDPEGITHIVKWVADEDGYRILESDCPSGCPLWGASLLNIWTKDQIETLQPAGELTLWDCEDKCVSVLTCRGINYKGSIIDPSECVLVLNPGELPKPIGQVLGWRGYKLIIAPSSSLQQLQQNTEYSYYQQQQQQQQQRIQLQQRLHQQQQQQQRIKVQSPPPVLRWIGPKDNIWAASQQCSLTHRGAMTLGECQSEAKLLKFNAINYKGAATPNSTSDCVLVLCPFCPIPAPGLNRPPYQGYEYAIQSGPPSA